MQFISDFSKHQDIFCKSDQKIADNKVSSGRYFFWPMKRQSNNTDNTVKGHNDLIVSSSDKVIEEKGHTI